MGRIAVVPVLVALLAGPAAAPTPAEAAPWRQETFLVGGFALARPEATSFRNQLATLDGLGFDWVEGGGYDHWARGLAASADTLLRERPGTRVRVILSLPVLSKNAAAGRSDEKSKVEKALRPDTGAPVRTNYRSTLGWFVWDEPDSKEKLDQAASLARIVRESPHGDGRLAYVNLLPIQAWEYDTGPQGRFRESFGERDMAAAYRNYLRGYLESVATANSSAPVLSVDHYPFAAAGRTSRWFLLNLALIDRETRAAGRGGRGVPWWLVIQLSRHNEGRVLTVAELHWQAWTALASGAKGIAYWSLGPVGTRGVDWWDQGLLLESGKPNPRWAEPVRALNRTLHTLGPTLMRLEHQSNWHRAAGNQGGIDDEVFPRATPEHAFVKDVTGTGHADVLVGCFRDRTGGADHLLVVNKSLDTGRTFTIVRPRPFRGIRRVDRTSGKEVAVTGSGTSFKTGTIGPGEGELYRVVE